MNATALPVRLVLHNRAMLDQKPRRAGMWLAGMLAFMLVLTVILVAYFQSEQGFQAIDWGKLAERGFAKLREDWAELALIAIGLIAAVLQIVYLALSHKRERLILDPLAIHYVSPLPAALAFLSPSWSLQWSQIRRAELKSGMLAPRPEFVTLTLDTGRRRRRLRPYMWVDPDTHETPDWRTHLRLSRPTPEALAAQIQDCPVVRYIHALSQLPFKLPSLERIGPFALERSPAALAFVTFFFAAVVYAFLDALIVNSETYAGDPFYELYLAAGLAMTAFAVWLMRRHEAPLAESVAVAVLCGGAFAAALYPGLLRINQFTDTAGLKSYEYEMTEPAHFLPLQPGPPELRFPDRHREFWQSHRIGTIEHFDLRKGGLGFYQIDMKPIYERIEGYYERERQMRREERSK